MISEYLITQITVQAVGAIVILTGVRVGLHDLKERVDKAEGKLDRLPVDYVPRTEVQLGLDSIRDLAEKTYSLVSGYLSGGGRTIHASADASPIVPSLITPRSFPMSTVPVVIPSPAKHTFFRRLLDEVGSIFRSKEPAWIVGANAVLQIGIPIVQEVLDLDFPALAPVVDPILSRVKVGMATLSLMAKQGGAHPTLLPTLQGLQTNLKQLEASVNITDDATKQKISTNLDLLVSELEAVEAMVTPTPAS